MKHTIPISLRRWEERAAARALADAILRADARRQRTSALPRPDKKRAPQVSAGPRRLHLSDLKRAFVGKRRLHIPSTGDIRRNSNGGLK